MKKRILVIGTGGTIASIKTKDGFRPTFKTEKLLSFFPEAADIADFEAKMLFNLDSTNIQPHHWSEIAREIEREYEKYDGFVITHGTDTMQYTSAALSFMLQNLSKPVVLTGSVKATTEKESDAKQNFIDSIIVACSGINGVTIVFHGKIIKGCNARKITNEATKITNECLGVYSSINNHLIGEIIGKLEDNGKRKIVLEKGYHDMYKNKKELEVRAKIDDCGNILLVKIYPGFRPDMLYKLSGDIKCIIIEAFGPGNIPFIENSLIDQIENLVQKNISVFITTQNPFGEVDMNLYEVGQKALKAGAIPCNDMTSETALVKLMWIMGNYGCESQIIKDMMQKNIAGEIRI